MNDNNYNYPVIFVQYENDKCKDNPKSLQCKKKIIIFFDIYKNKNLYKNMKI